MHVDAVSPLAATTLPGAQASPALRRRWPLTLVLVIVSAIPVLNALTMVFQIPAGPFPADSAHLEPARWSMFAHVVAGVAFGLTGPVQFVRAVRQRFGTLHRITGRIFVVAAVFLGVSGLSVLLQVTSQRTLLVDVARGVFSLAILFAVAQAMRAIVARDIPRHRAWAVRAWAIGMGLGTVSLVFFPIYLITGAPPTGLGADILLVASWLLTLVVAEAVIRRSPAKGRIG